MEGALKFTIFYFALLIILTTVSVYIPVEGAVIGTLNDDQNAILNNVIEPPKDANIFSNTIYIAQTGNDFLAKTYILITVSSSHQFVLMFILIFTIAEIFIIASWIRGI